MFVKLRNAGRGLKVTPDTRCRQVETTRKKGVQRNENECIHGLLLFPDEVI